MAKMNPFAAMKKGAGKVPSPAVPAKGGVGKGKMAGAGKKMAMPMFGTAPAKAYPKKK